MTSKQEGLAVSELAMIYPYSEASNSTAPSEMLFETHPPPLSPELVVSKNENDTDERTALLANSLESSPVLGFNSSLGSGPPSGSDREPLVCSGAHASNPQASASCTASVPILMTDEAAVLPSKNADIDLENDEGSEATCRICLEAGEAEDELISPCRCKGTQQFVHRKCLDHWRAVKEGFAFAHCTTCKAQFHLHPDVPDDVSWRQRKFHLFVTRDLCFVFLGLQLAVMLLALGVAFSDSRGQLAVSYGGGAHPLLFYYCCGLFIFLVLLGILGLYFQCCYGTYMDVGPCGGACAGNCGSELAMGAGCGELLLVAIVIFAFLGAFYGVLAAMMAWQKIWQRHYHILAKKVLAEEYIVVDLNGDYTEPHLDPVDEERLRLLGFLS